MRARSAIFDVYGDHLLAGTGWASVAGLVQLNEAVDIAAPATRTAVSRMVREGWLDAEPRAGVRGYAMTARAKRRLSSAWHRIYAEGQAAWDGSWHVVVTDRLPDRSERGRLRAAMEYLGYARMAPDTWIAPRAGDDLARSLDPVRHHSFTARYDGDLRDLAATWWDLDALARTHRDYLAWLEHLRRQVSADGPAQQVYAARTRAVHEWRKFLFTDPDLPTEVLPADWPGRASRAGFLQVAAAWRPAASAYVEQCLATDRNTHPKE